MPDMNFAIGAMKGFTKSVQDERDRKDKNNAFIIDALMRSGRVKDFNELTPFLNDMLGATGKAKSSKGGAGKDGGGPLDMLGTIINPLLKQHYAKGPFGTSGGDGGGAAPASGGSGASGASGDAVPAQAAPPPTPDGPRSTPATPAPQPASPDSPRSTLPPTRMPTPQTATLPDAARRNYNPLRDATPLAQSRSTIGGHPVGLYTQDEIDQRDASAYQQKSEIDARRQIEVNAAKPTNLQQKFVRYQGKDISAGWDPRTNKYYDAQGNELVGAVEKPQGKETGALAERTKQIAARLGIDPTSERARQLAATQLEQERSTKQQQAATRLNTYVAMSRQALLTNTERYNEMQEMFPYTLALKMAGLEVAQMRPDLIRQALEKGSQSLERGDLALETGRENLNEKYATAATRQAAGEARLKKLQTEKIDRDGQKEASKIVEAATRQAAQLAGKKSSVLMGLGLEEDEDAIRKRLIQEMSGGQDPDKVEALAKSRIDEGASAPAAAAPARRAAPATGASANPYR